MLILAGEDMALDAAVLRPAHVSGRKAFQALPPAAVIVSGMPAEAEKVATVFSAAHSRESTSFPPGTSLFILSTGPQLDSPDRVETQSLVRRGNAFFLTVIHTNVRLQDAALLRNIAWRPMVKARLPADLAAGSYEVHVSWQPLDKLPGGRPLGEALSQTVPFEVRRR
jgi:hypothetical protein